MPTKQTTRIMYDMIDSKRYLFNTWTLSLDFNLFG